MNNEKLIGVLLVVTAIVSLPVLGFDIAVFAFLMLLGVVLIFSQPDDPDSKEYRIFHRSYEDFEREYRRKW